MKRVSHLRETVHSLLFIAVSVIVIIWLSVFCYGTFYYFYIPPVAHIKPVFLQFDTSCQIGLCSFPTANVTLVQRGHNQLLSKGQQYLISVDLEMPESAVNRRLGMFMVKLSFISQDGLLISSAFRSALLHYKSNLLRYVNTLVFAPLLLAGSWEEKQTVTVPLFENYNENPDYPAYSANIELHSRTIEIYSAKLRINAHFSGLRYYMYYWPILSALVGISTNFYFLVLMAILSWFRFLQWQRNVGILEPLAIDSGSLRIQESEDPFSPVPVSLDPSDSTNEDPVSGLRPPSLEWKQSKERLSVQSHSSVQDLDMQRSFSEDPLPSEAQEAEDSLEWQTTLRRKSESF